MQWHTRTYSKEEKNGVQVIFFLFCVPCPDRSRHGTIGMHAAHTNKSKYYGPREAGGVRRVGERKAVVGGCARG